MVEKEAELAVDDEAQPNFFLRKWYADGVDSAGRLYIGYWVRVCWKRIDVQMYQQIFYTPRQGLWTQTRIAELPPPAWQREEQLVWKPPQTAAIWQTAVSPLSKTLIENEEGRIMWHCPQPKAHANIKAPGLDLSGWGYTEYLDLTIPVWRLPFTTLYWGRAHSLNHHLVWIVWDGQTSGKLLWQDGRLSPHWRLENNLPQHQTLQTTVNTPLPLRQGMLLSTVFGAYRHLTRLFPQAAFLADEQKWFGSGCIETETGAEPATFIYEKVLW